MKSSLFTKGFKILIVTLLLLAVLFNRSLAQKLMLATILIWMFMVIVRFLKPTVRKLIENWYADRQYRRNITPLVLSAPMPDEAISFSPVPEPEPAFSEAEQKRMLQHISLRITEKIKSAYPDATWRWADSPDLTAILDGKTFRIQVDDMAAFTHADIRFDRYARIRITPLSVGEFASSADSGKKTPSEEDTKEPAVVDVISWYKLIGRQMLESVITDLNANGHSRLSIKENGDIIITRNKKEALKGTLDQFPPKNYWNEFLNLLEEQELHGKVEKDRIIISWV